MERQAEKRGLRIGSSNSSDKTRRRQDKEVTERCSEEERQAGLHDLCEGNCEIEEGSQQNLRQQSHTQFGAIANVSTTW